MTGAQARALAGATLGLVLVLGYALAAGGVGNGQPRQKPDPAAPGAPVSMALMSAVSPEHGVVEGRVAIAAVTLHLELSQDAARAGQPVRARATLVNQTGTSVAMVSVALHGPRGATVRPADARVVRRLAAHASEAVTWIVCAREAGTYTLVAAARVDGVTVQSEPRILTVSASGSC